MNNDLKQALGQPWAPEFTRVVRGVHHLVLNTEDMKATIDFYSGVLGMPLVGAITVEEGLGTGADNRGNPPYENLRHYFFDMGNDSMLAFFEMPKGVRKHGDRDDLGNMQHVSFVVSAQMQLAMKERLIAFGYEAHGPVRVSPGSDSLYFRDPVNDIRLEFSTAPAQGEHQDVMANRSQTKAMARKELEQLCNDPQWLERTLRYFKD